MMTLMSGVLETCVCVLKTCVPSRTGRSARLFFMLEAHGPQARHVVTPVLTSAGRRGPVPSDTWQRQSPPQLGGKIRSHRTRGSVGAHLSLEARSRAAGHVAAPEPISVGGEVRSHMARGSTWMHTLLLVLT
jgi:hypothetical protein